MYNVRFVLPTPRRSFSKQVSWPSFLATPRTAAVIGAPGQFGQPLAGTDKGPSLLREAGLHQSLAALDWRVEELGDVVSCCVELLNPTYLLHILN